MSSMKVLIKSSFPILMEMAQDMKECPRIREDMAAVLPYNIRDFDLP